ncbi:MAG: hypothetical protein JWQ57_2400 [Mucilaginibacter sp.]|nr:hypothetical protein [Mucilaginibacter sp.]
MIIDHYYPTAAGAILTGSQQYHEHIDPAHDVDIIIIDPRFSVVSSVTLTISGITLDFVHLPLNDLDNCLQNESFDLQGILFLMIKTGKVIRDSEQGLAAFLQQSVIERYGHLNPPALDEYKRLVRELSKLKKDVLRKNKVYNSFFLIHEFFSMITEAEVIRQTNWKHTGKRKAEIILKGNPALGKGIVRNIVRFHASPLTESLTWIRHYIDLFMAMPLPVSPEQAKPPLFIFDIYSQHISIDYFLTEILPVIMEDPYLAAKYEGFYLSPKRYDKIYRNFMSVVFKATGDELGDVHIYLLKRLRSRDPSVRLNAAPAYIGSRIQPFTPILRKTSALLNIAGSGSPYDYERNLVTLLILATQLFKQLDIAVPEFLRLTFYLTNRYLLDKKTQDEIRTLDQHREFINKRMASFHRYYVDNKEFLDTLMAGTLSSDIEGAEKPHTVIGSAIKELTTSQTISDLTGSYKMTVRILAAHYGQSEPEKSAFFVIVFENLHSFLLLTPEQSALALFILSESLNIFIHTAEDRNRT